MKVTLTRENFREMSIFFANNPGASDMELEVNTKFPTPGPGHGERSPFMEQLRINALAKQARSTTYNTPGNTPIHVVYAPKPITEEERLRREAEELLSSLDI